MFRVALLFDDTLRFETTGVYCRRALVELARSGRISEVEHICPSDLSGIARESGRWDLIIAVDDGLDYDLPASVVPIAWWAIDTHLDFDRALRRAKRAKWTFAAQRNGTERLVKSGIAAEWLPLACDPVLHGRQEVSLGYDWSFVGNLLPGERSRLVELLRQRIPRCFVGQKYFAEMAVTYSASKIAFNRSVLDDVNMRVFEILCSGALLVTNDLSINGQQELFQDGVHLATYRSDEELIEQMRRYLADDNFRHRVASAGREEVLARHTYRHRMERLLEVVQGVGSVSPERRIDSRITNGVKTETPEETCLSSSHLQTSFLGKGADVNAQKSAMYFEFDRKDVQELVPKTAARILDLGCGAGRLGSALIERQQAHVTGVEFNPAAAGVARTRLDDVRVANLESDELDFADSTFDCVICADILEHLRQPELLLKKIRRWLTPGSSLVLSIPNIRNHTVIRSLLAGNWTYETAGLLDADHVRFFTRREIEKLLFRSGFEIDELRMVPGEGYSEWVSRGRPRDLAVNGFQVRVASSEEAAEFFAYQYLVRAVMQPVSGTNRIRQDATDGLKLLAEEFAWPATRPVVSIPHENQGWLADGARELLAREASEKTKLVIELGSWLGLSTRFLADRAPNAKVIAIDHWQGSPEHHRKQEYREILPQLYEGFLDQCWDYRNRIQPLPLSTNDGLIAVAKIGLEPDLIFIDADHTYASVKADLQNCRRLFGRSTLTGDDFDDPDVQQAVQEVADDDGLALETFGQKWRAWKLSAPSQQSAESPLAPMRNLVTKQYGLTSVVVVTWNEISYTQMCLDSLVLRTDEPYELIIVDNGSTDGTVEYLRSIASATIIENQENRGFPAAVNQALRVARGENILLLNNDTILTTGWLRRMLEALYADDQIGLVGPTSNCVGSEQQIEAGYSHLNELDGFAWDRKRQLIAQREPLIQESDRLIGFCLLFKREVMDAIGLLDERFGIGCFEDDDYCRRARNAGYRAVIARHVFVHHFGSVTFRGSGANLGEILEMSRQKFNEKWAGDRIKTSSASTDETRPTPTHPLGKPKPDFVLTQDSNGNLTIEPNEIRLSGCLIVRDNEATIRSCLESLKPWVDELIVIDTGSTDATSLIAEEIGARVFHWPWRDDFAAARNESLDHARGEWIFWMDSDDVISEECGRELRRLATGPHDDRLFGYVMQVHCPGDDVTDVTIVDHVKLIRNRPDLRFEFRIHEQILPAIRRAGGDVAFTENYVVHAGSDRTKAGQAKKLERDFKLLHLELAERPDHPFVLFNLGMTHADCGQHEDAIRCLRRCLEVSQSNESHVRKAYSILISSLMQSQRLTDAEQLCLQGRSIFPEDKELLFRKAMIEHQLGRLKEAVDSYRDVLSTKSSRHFESIDAGLDNFKARHNLALVYEDQGKFESAANEWQRITSERPHYVAAWRGLIMSWLQLQRFNDVLQLIKHLETSPKSALRNLAPYAKGMLYEKQGKIEEALSALSEADRLEPQEVVALRQKCRLLFENGRWSTACEALRELSNRAPDDASVRHNLGIASVNTGDFANAAAAFESSLLLRPDHLETIELLADVRKMKNSGHVMKSAY